MNEKNILRVIEELGAIINTYENEIKYKDVCIENLKTKIERIEEYIKTLENKGA